MLEESAIYQEVLQKGIRQGRQEGIIQGELQGRRHILTLLLKQKLNRVTPAIHRNLSALSDTQLDELAIALRDMQNHKDLHVWFRIRRRQPRR